MESKQEEFIAECEEKFKRAKTVGQMFREIVLGEEPPEGQENE